MKYNNIVKGIFLSRPNRFIAHVNVNGEEVICHVKNTGRCRELLIPNSSVVYLEDHGDNKKRKTRYSLISVIKKTDRGDMLINMDSQAPNKVAKEWLESGGLYKNITYIKPEKTFEDSRFDLYFEYINEEGKLIKAFMEVKGITLEEDGIVRFPDAPTERGTKHVNGLIKAKRLGYDAYILFVVQLEHFNKFEPNVKTDKKFAEALEKAEEEGVKILVKPCIVSLDSLKIK